MNLAAAGGTEAFGLFGSTPVLTYSKFIHAIVPDGGPSPGGMQRIAPAQVLKHIAPYLSQRRPTFSLGGSTIMYLSTMLPSPEGSSASHRRQPILLRGVSLGASSVMI